ncbi:MAG: TolC family protein [Candidatus Cloacimonetes bacterium]|nr:TolC family protein [Candidatus Cloacimonadota bacterium]
MKRVLTILVLGVLLASTWAQEVAFDALPSLSMEAAKAQALKNNPAYQAKEAAFSAAKWAKTNAISTVLPSLSFGGTYLYNDPAVSGQMGAATNKDMRTMSLNLSQPVFLGGKAWQAYKISSTSAEIAELSYQNQRYTLLSDVESKYLSALQLKSVYQISQMDLKSANDNLALAKIKQDNGLLSRADYLRFQSRLASKEVSALQAQTSLQLVLTDLANYLGASELMMPEEIAMENEESFIAELDTYDLAVTNRLSGKMVQLASNRNLSYQIMDKSVELSKRAYNIAKASFLPTLMLTGSRQYRENGIDRYKFAASNQIMLNLSVPLLPGVGFYSSAQKAKEESRKASLDAKTATDGIKLGVESATLNWVSSAKQVQSAKLALSYSEELYLQMQERFRMNMISTLELLDAELMLSSARMTYNTTIYTYLKSRSALMQALAVEDVNELYTLIEN